jgi:hypothetical protein
MNVMAAKATKVCVVCTWAIRFFNIKTLCKIKGTPNGQSPRVYEVALRGPEMAFE